MGAVRGDSSASESDARIDSSASLPCSREGESTKETTDGGIPDSNAAVAESGLVCRVAIDLFTGRKPSVLMATPLEVFDELWDVFAYHCAFLELRSGTRDWHLPEYRARWRDRAAGLPQTQHAATGPELMALLGEVVRLFSDDTGGAKPDIHCFLLDGKGDEVARNDPPAFVAFDRQRRQQWMEHAAACARADFVRHQGQFKFGMAATDVGYIQLNGMEGFTHVMAPSGGYADEYAQLAGIADCMKDSISFFKKHRAKGVIIDVRFNSGGFDHIGMTVASHFFTGQVLGFSKRSRLPTAAYAGPTGAQLEWTDFSVDSRFVGGLAPERTMDCPVAVLISGYTLSAAEVFTLMMQAHADCTFIGSPTCGCYSDILLVALGNGWQVGLSNQVYTNYRGENYEGKGLVPDVPAGEAYPSAVELREGRDSALAAAVGLLSRDASSRL